MNPILQQCIFDPNAFKDVVTVIVDVASSLTTPDATSVYMDNVNHTNYY